jgi:hypothetical protein
MLKLIIKRIKIGSWVGLLKCRKVFYKAKSSLPSLTCVGKRLKIFFRYLLKVDLKNILQILKLITDVINNICHLLFCKLYRVNGIARSSIIAYGLSV